MTEQSWTVSDPQTIDVDDVSSLKLGVFRGSFDISPAPDGRTHITISDVQGEPLTVSSSDGHLEIRQQPHGPQGWLRSLMQTVHTNTANSAVISIQLPATADVEAGTVSGTGNITGLQAHVKLNTVSGTLSTAATSGDLHVNTVSGGVTVVDHDGVLTAKSVSGEVAASGRFTHIRANTVSGNMTFDLLGFTEDFGANSVSGDLTVLLPADVGVDLVANSPGGGFVIDNQSYSPAGGKLQTIAGPDARLLLARTNSVSGTVTFAHKPASEA
ncbi:DUF4097 family beta strand repeat-containing protein [Pseudarthrobacter sp. J75]|uniref:DUF4097 family beta strand repeat-containing protein n=1 Tax=unclassified Pseudarthrobacter TaxID=2647000 RepID=UPI002E80173E|nr:MULTISPECIES: DUF4097 family beta strand repeat-containing protein [unclassified Pseudarthrobacter]MEE2521430.1 DUF4097 family beta strand repeat-containing protein [Pseudarthrobacter sp. J47]MEE2528662.1 DUF4097 family beta strand repeat-containing protein [Pseudarthrobacter sp. J75]MEE2568354.1 DUF4097 family beta strand repeat-containing protein [Pseudarthrobacter sp. J64]